MSCQGISKEGKKCRRWISKNKSFCCYHNTNYADCLEGGETQFHMRYNKHTKIFQLLRNNIVVYEDRNRKNVEEMFNDLWNMEREEQIRLGLLVSPKKK
jgi:hypothetical protein